MNRWQQSLLSLSLAGVEGVGGGGVLGHGLGALGDGVLGQLARQQQANGSLDLATGDGRLLVVVAQAAGLRGDALEDVVHEGVHDGHGLRGDANVVMHLAQHLVHVDVEGFLALHLALLLLRAHRGALLHLRAAALVAGAGGLGGGGCGQSCGGGLLAALLRVARGG